MDSGQFARVEGSSLRKALRLRAPKWRSRLILLATLAALVAMTGCIYHIETRVAFYANDEWKADIQLSFTPELVMLLGGEQALDARVHQELGNRLGIAEIDYALHKQPRQGGGLDYIVSIEGRGLDAFREAVFSKSYVSEVLAGPISLTLTGAVTEGQTLSAALDSNPSTGYRWHVGPMREGMLRQLGESEFRQGSTLLGAPGTQVLRFEVVATGRTTLELKYERPWEEGVEPARRVVLDAVDLDLAELLARLGSATPAPPTTSEDERASPEGTPQPTTTEGVGLPSTYNWCTLGACTSIKDQGGCGSCWAFGTVAPLESKILYRTGVEKDLSEQYLVSCNMDDWGCSGGWWAHAYHVNEKQACESEVGAVREPQFPYEGEDVPCCGPCPFSHPYRLRSWGCVSAGASKPDCCTGAVLPTGALKQAIVDHGPISVAVCAGSAFQGYQSGVFETDEPSYCQYGINHAVVLVGWDDSQGAHGVWILRNSWGTGWGEDGYMRIGYGISNVGSCASYINGFAAGNRLRNGGFECCDDASIPKYWSSVRLGSTDARLCSTSHDGRCAFRFVGVKRVNKSLTQQRRVAGSAGDTVTLSAWSKAVNPWLSGGPYCAEAVVKHSDGTRATHRVCFPKTSRDWVYRSMTFAAAKPYWAIQVKLLYWNQTGSAWFDQVTLLVR